MRGGRDLMYRCTVGDTAKNTVHVRMTCMLLRGTRFCSQAIQSHTKLQVMKTFTAVPPSSLLCLLLSSIHCCHLSLLPSVQHKHHNMTTVSSVFSEDIIMCIFHWGYLLICHLKEFERRLLQVCRRLFDVLSSFGLFSREQVSYFSDLLLQLVTLQKFNTNCDATHREWAFYHVNVTESVSPHPLAPGL